VLDLDHLEHGLERAEGRHGEEDYRRLSEKGL
jgi:hypothetical protein